MKAVVIAVVVAGCAALSSAQSITPAKPSASVPPPPPSSQSQPAHPHRALAKLDGFDLAPSKATANQIGGASRGVGSQKLVLYAPHKARIYTLRPAFSWKGEANAQYKLHIQDLTGGFSWDREVTGTSLAYPSDAPPLEPGATYLWKVEPLSPLLGPPPPAVMIVVIGGPERAQMDADISQIPGTGLDADQGKARYFFDHRLWYDAVMVSSDLIARHPDRSDLYEMRAMLYYQLPETEPLADADLAHSK
ncbi:MAG: DUF928 domain-containing protein [Terracidiphilus sp.]|jgi:hypothetical protein